MSDGRSFITRRGSTTQYADVVANGGIAQSLYSALPTADADNRGAMMRTEGGSGVADVLAVSAKMANGSYTAGRIPIHGVDIIELYNAAAKSLAGDTSVQSPFTAANDTITVEAATRYVFDANITITGGTTSHTIAFTLKGGGTATITAIAYSVVHVSGTANTVTSNDIDFVQVIADDGTGVVVTPAITSAATTLLIRGNVVINAAGTLIPSIKFSADPQGTEEATIGSYLTLLRRPSNAVGPLA